MTRLVWVTLLLVCGCVTIKVPPPKAGEFSNYREFAYNRSRILSWPGVPAELQAKARTCMVDVSIGYITPTEMERLNAAPKSKPNRRAGVARSATGDRSCGAKSTRQ